MKIRFADYLPEFIYGGIDGSITTFAVVAGAAGAQLDSSVVIILGFANLIADGFSMSIGSYLSSQSEQHAYEQQRNKVKQQIITAPQLSRNTVKSVYAAKGLSGNLLEQTTQEITAQNEVWVDTLMKEQLELLPPSKSAKAMAVATFISFNLVGFIPLSIYLIERAVAIPYDLFSIAIALTLIAFVGIGWLKSYVTDQPIWRSIGETVLLGVIAAVLAYGAGNYLEKLFN